MKGKEVPTSDELMNMPDDEFGAEMEKVRAIRSGTAKEVARRMIIYQNNPEYPYHLSDRQMVVGFWVCGFWDDAKFLNNWEWALKKMKQTRKDGHDENEKRGWPDSVYQ